MSYFGLKRRKPEPMGIREEVQVRCNGHLSWVRGWECAVINKKSAHECFGKTEAAHVRTGTDGGTSLKPGDNFTIPLCAAAHREQHAIGEPAFERMYGIDMKKIAAHLWKISPHGKAYRREQDNRRDGC